jgi:hypothetical protein
MPKISSMDEEVFSINKLASLLQRDRRTISAALKDTPPDASWRWRLDTARTALALHERRTRDGGGR